MRFFTVASCAILVITAACSDQKNPGVMDSEPTAEAPAAEILHDLQTRVVPSLPDYMRAGVTNELDALMKASQSNPAVFQSALERSLASVDALLEQRSGSPETVDLQSIRLGLETVSVLRSNH